jgi:MATE family multidrug resistance protein
VRVSNELGAGHPMATSFSVKVVTTLSLMVASIIAVIVMCLRDYISYVFTKGDDVARAVSTMTPLLAVTIVLNGIQPVLSGMYNIYSYHYVSQLRIIILAFRYIYIAMYLDIHYIIIIHSKNYYSVS